MGGSNIYVEISGIEVSFYFGKRLSISIYLYLHVTKPTSTYSTKIKNVPSITTSMYFLKNHLPLYSKVSPGYEQQILVIREQNRTEERTN